MFASRLFSYLIYTDNQRKMREKQQFLSEKLFLFIFLLLYLSQNFVCKTEAKLIDGENVCFYQARTLYWIKFVFKLFFSFDILLFFIGICLRTTQNIMFSALKPKSTCQATFKFSIAVSLAMFLLLQFFHFSSFN